MKKLLLLAVSFLTATAALADDKTLVLTIGRSTLFTRDVPRISLGNGPLAEDERAIGLEIDMKSFVNYFAKYKVVKRENDFYRESRSFRDGHAEIQLRQVDGTVTTKVFDLAPNAAEKHVIAVSDFLWDVEAVVTGTVDVYKCFDQNTCVLEQTRTERIFVEKERSVSVEHNFHLLVACRENGFWVELDGGVDHPQIQRLRLHRTVSRHYLKVDEIIPAKSKSTLTGAQFTGFKTNIGEFGLYPGGSSPGTTMEVTYAQGKFAMETRNANGGFRSSFEFSKCANFP